MVNAIGKAFIDSQDKSFREVLVELFGHESQSARFVAYCFLRRESGFLDEKSLEAVDYFRRLPENVNIVAVAANEYDL